LTPAEETATLPIKLSDRVADISPLHANPVDSSKNTGGPGWHPAHRPDS
jgi:hypothetical protein